MGGLFGAVDVAPESAMDVAVALGSDNWQDLGLQAVRIDAGGLAVHMRRWVPAYTLAALATAGRRTESYKWQHVHM